MGYFSDNYNKLRFPISDGPVLDFVLLRSPPRMPFRHIFSARSSPPS